MSLFNSHNDVKQKHDISRKWRVKLHELHASATRAVAVNNDTMQILYKTRPAAAPRIYWKTRYSRSPGLSRTHATCTYAYAKQDNSRSPRISYGARFHKLRKNCGRSEMCNALCTLTQTFNISYFLNSNL